MKDQEIFQHVGILHYPGAQKSAVHGFVDLFDAAMARVESLSLGTVRLETSVIEAQDALPADPHRPLTALILPPSPGAGFPVVGPSLTQWLQRRHAQGTVIGAVGAGTFMLARTGLLDGRRATTHWDLAASFRRRHPQVRLDAGQLLVDEGDLITTGGLMAWVDLGLKLVERYCGRAVMLSVARRFLVDPAGRNQKFYRQFVPDLTHGDEAVLRVQVWLEEQTPAKVTVPMMAARAELTGRTFLRRFTRATGFKPVQYLQQLRVAQARKLLETSALSAEQVAHEVGYTDAAAFRRIFGRLVGLPPGEYRRRFGMEIMAD